MDARTPNYDWWENALAGQFGPIHDGHPQPGFYRYRDKADRWHAVAIWHDGGKMIAVNDGKPIDPNTIWTWAAKNPISHRSYTDWQETGRFHDDAPAPPEAKGSVPGHNVGDGGTIYDSLRREALDLGERLADFVDKAGKSKIETQDAADRAAVLARQAGDLAKKADDEREEEKRPHLQSCRAVDDKWRDVVALAKTTSTDAKAAIGPFLKRQKEAEEKRAAESRRAFEEAAARSKALAQSARPADKVAAEELAKEAATHAAAAKPRKVSAGRTGAKVTTRTTLLAVIDDFDAALAHFKPHPAVHETIQHLAQQAVTAGATVPGVKAVPQEKAV